MCISIDREDEKIDSLCDMLENGAVSEEESPKLYEIMVMEEARDVALDILSIQFEDQLLLGSIDSVEETCREKLFLDWIQ